MSTFSNKVKKAFTFTAGQREWVKYTLTSSSITTTAQSLTPTVTGGEFAITQVIFQTDGTGLATGTNFNLQTTNGVAANQKGVAVFVSEAVSNLGANATRALFPYQGGTNKYQFSITGVPSVLVRGSSIQYLCTSANCTGAGTIDIYIQLERLDGNAQLSAGTAAGLP